MIAAALFVQIFAGMPGDAQTPAPQANAAKYTIAWISDTQRYSASYKETFPVMTKYLRDERTRLNLGYVAMTGDIVKNGANGAQWQTAKAALDLLDPVPYGVLAGNHDRNGRSVYTNYTANFGEGEFSAKAYYGGSYKDNVGHYDLIRMGSTDFIFVYMSYQPDAAMIEWANSVFQKYPGRVGALCVHDYFDSSARLGGMGKTLQREVVAANKNVYMVLCGHRYTTACVPASFDDDGDGAKERTVYQCIANYQTLERGGQGYIRFIEIDEARAKLRFYTYSPLLGAFRKTSKDEELPLPWGNV